MQLPKHSTLMHPNDYTRLEQLRCVYEGPLAGLPQRRKMAFDESETGWSASIWGWRWASSARAFPA